MKIKQKILIIILACFLLFPGTIHANPLQGELIQRIQLIRETIYRVKRIIMKHYLQQEINAESYFVVNLSDNSTTFEKNIEKTYPIASITKLMTAIITVENIDLNQEIILREEMLQSYGYSPSLFAGATVTARDLLVISLTQSTNDASHSLTFFMRDGEFLRLMNKKAREIGMHNTKFYDAHGLNSLNQSTSSDIIKLLRFIYDNYPHLLCKTKEDDFWLPDPTGRLLKFRNVNNFYNESWFIGGKTGYLPEAKQTFAAIFDIDGEVIAISILYSSNRRQDTLKIIEKIRESSDLAVRQ